MCPIFDFDCRAGHAHEEIRHFERRDDPATCRTCGLEARRREISRPHCVPDGMYSYAPNVGDANHFEMRREGMKNGQKLFKKEVREE